jgi:hypothetical protein
MRRGGGRGPRLYTPAYRIGNSYDTPVLDSISFVDTTWLGRGGLMHSVDMHIVEKFTRKGDEILCEVTLSGPPMFVEPWMMAPDGVY